MKGILVFWTVLAASSMALANERPTIGPAPAISPANQRIVVKTRADVEAAELARLYGHGGVAQYARFEDLQLDFCILSSAMPFQHAKSMLEATDLVEYVEPDHIVSVEGLPNDPYFALQWAMHNARDNDIDAPEAWNVLRPTRDPVVVGIIDSGIDYDHEDLRDNVWVNAGEIPGNGIDDDGNGFVDDVHGWDFFHNTNDPRDHAGHGTHVAGIIGAIGNNARGIAGIDWQARLMAVKFIHSNWGYTSAAIRSVEYAANNGATVLNASWGSFGHSRALEEAIALAHARGVVFVGAAGNYAVNNDVYPYYPASYPLPNVISVAASGQSDDLVGFSHYGPNSVDIAAPGYFIVSAIPGNRYAYMSGTSMAAPMVSAVAAIIQSYNPGIGPEKLASFMVGAADAVPALQGRLLNAKRVNARNCASPLPVPRDFMNYLYYLLVTDEL